MTSLQAKELETLFGLSLFLSHPSSFFSYLFFCPQFCCLVQLFAIKIQTWRNSTLFFDCWPCMWIFKVRLRPSVFLSSTLRRCRWLEFPISDPGGFTHTHTQSFTCGRQCFVSSKLTKTLARDLVFLVSTECSNAVDTDVSEGLKIMLVCQLRPHWGYGVAFVCLRIAVHLVRFFYFWFSRCGWLLICQNRLRAVLLHRVSCVDAARCAFKSLNAVPVRYLCYVSG